MINSKNEHDVKCSPEKGGHKQLVLETQSELNHNVLNATPKDGVNYLKETCDNKIMKNHTPWGKGCTSDVEVAHDCNTMCDTTDVIKEINSKKEVATDIASLCLACHKERSS